MESKNLSKSKERVFLESQQAMLNMLTKLSQKMDLQMKEMKEWGQQNTYSYNIFMKRSEPTVCFAHTGINP